MNRIKEVYIANDTLYPIAATLRLCDLPKGIILINSGTCIRRSFYDDIASFFAHQSYITLQYDYVGVGGSRPEDLSEVDRSIYDWGSKDMEIVSNWIDTEFPGLNKYIIGHSMGGQIIGLMSSVNSFKRIITIASSYGNPMNYTSFALKWSMLIGAYALFPIVIRLVGYFPANRLGFGLDWPYGVANDWCKWNTRYLSLRQWMDKLDQPHYFNNVSVSITSYVMSDDHMAPPKLIPHFQIDYPHADIHVVNPSDYNLEALGHFNGLKPMAIAFWKDLLRELEQATL